MIVVLKTLAICVFFTVAFAQPVEIKKCPGFAGECKIENVHINNCVEFTGENVCKVKRNRSVNITYDFTPDFDAEVLESKVFWVTGVDLQYIGMDQESCKYTKCPIVKGETQHFHQAFQIIRRSPLQTLNLKWRMTAEDNKECCFIFTVKIVR